jgi:hypothetical protein
VSGVTNAFRELARQGPQEAPPSVELALLAAFRKRRARRSWPWWAASIAAVLVGAVLVSRPHENPRPDARVVHIGVPHLRSVAQQSLTVAAQNRRRGAKRVRKTDTAPREIATGFYPLRDAATLPPFEYGTLVRVQLPRSALQVVGLPVNQDRLSERINADVLLGQDGLARAVRFVQ